MIPNVFVSSTVQDLQHLRDAVRDVLVEMGLNPVMSEWGEIGYVPSMSAQDACYLALRDCQLVVVLVGKRYGSLSENGLSVTHNELRIARERGLPIILLVHEEVLAFKKVHDYSSPPNEGPFPGMEGATQVFALVSEHGKSIMNNGLLSFSHVQSAKQALKQQVAHLFGDLLRKHHDPVKGEVKDILTEISTLRHMLLVDKKNIARRYARAYRFILEENNELLKDAVEVLSGSLEKGVSELLDSTSFSDYMKREEITVELWDTDRLAKESWEDDFFRKTGLTEVAVRSLNSLTRQEAHTSGGARPYVVEPELPEDGPRVIFGYGHGRFIGNKNSLRVLEAIHSKFLEHVDDA